MTTDKAAQLEQLKKIVIACLEHDDSARIIKRETGMTEQEIDDFYNQLTEATQ